MQEPFVIQVIRRAGKYYVIVGMKGPGKTDWVKLPDVIVVEPTIEDLVAAFQESERRIRKAQAEHPAAAERQHPAQKYWEVIGAKTAIGFGTSSSLCDIFRSPNLTRVGYMAPHPEWRGWLYGVGESMELPPDAAYEDIARIVIDLFAQNPPPPGDKTPAPKRSARKPARSEK